MWGIVLLATMLPVALCAVEKSPHFETATELRACKARVTLLSAEIGRLRLLVRTLQIERSELETTGSESANIDPPQSEGSEAESEELWNFVNDGQGKAGHDGKKALNIAAGQTGRGQSARGNRGRRRREESEGSVASSDALAGCTGREEAGLVMLGMRSSQLDDRESLANLVSSGDEKQALRSLVGAVSTGGGYGNDAVCTWLIAPPDAKSVTLLFIAFETEADYDFVKVYAGFDASGVELASLTGDLSSGQLPKITSPTGSMFIVLTSDNSGARTGFKATYRSDNAPAGLLPIEEPSSNVCLPDGARIYLSSACRACVLGTISHACGEGCLLDQVHISVQPGAPIPAPWPCLPLLRNRLLTEQGRRLERALGYGEPFGLTCVGVNDLYIPATVEAHIKKPVYVGLDTGYFVVSCEATIKQPAGWVITGSSDRMAWKTCKGLIWIDTAAGEARSPDALDGTSLPMVVHTGFQDCGPALKSVPSVSNGKLLVEGGTPSIAVVCWLQRFFGPQVAATGVPQGPMVVELAAGLASIQPLGDIVVRSGQQVTLVGNLNTLELGKRQVRVQQGGELVLEGIVIANSSGASAILVEGKLVLKNSTVRNCTARMNVFSSEGLQSRGGGLYATGGGVIQVLGSHVEANSVQEGMQYSEGGAIYATNGSHVLVASSKMLANSATAAGASSKGGAIAAFGDSSVSVIGSTLARNIAERGRTRSEGGAVSIEQGTADLDNSSLLDNSAMLSNGRSTGGAITATQSIVRLRSSTLRRNTARGAPICSGGAVHVSEGSLLVVMHTEFVENSVHSGSFWVIGGAVTVERESSLKATASLFHRNFANDSVCGSVFFSFSAEGGAVAVAYHSRAEVDSTVLLANSVAAGSPFCVVGSDQHAQGGAVFVYRNSTVHLLDVRLHENTAKGSDFAAGGACYVERQSALIVHDSSLANNSVSNGAVSTRGGGIAGAELSTIVLLSVRLLDNLATSQSAHGWATGGAVDIDSTVSTLSVGTCELLRNVVLSNTSAAGGAIHVGQRVVVQINDSQVRGNRVAGSLAKGGAVWFSGDEFGLSNVSLTQNEAFANGAGGYGEAGSALGGAIFTDGRSMQLIECKLFENRATMADPAVQASGGALHVGASSRVLLLRSMLKNNVAGGPGYYQLHGWNHPFTAGVVYSSSALHIFSEGFVILDDCDMQDDVGLAGFEAPKYSMWFWIVLNGGAVQLLGSRFATSATHSYDLCVFQDNGSCDTELGGCIPGTDYRDCGTEPPPASGPFGKLIMVYARTARLEMRGCTVRNLTMHGTEGLDSPVGIVNSTFQPVLSRSPIATVMPSPTCATKVVNRALCDPRALCETRPTGGVQCACIGAGLRDKPGVIPDGADCAQDTSISMHIEAHSMVIKVQKPGNVSETMNIVVRAEGDEPYMASYTLSIAHTSSLGQLVNTSRWDHVDAQWVSMHGHHVIWDRPPSNDSYFAVEVGKQNYVATKAFGMQVRLDCSGQKICIADGDTVKTVIEIGTASSPALQRAVISVTTEVIALISCENSEAWVVGNSVQNVPASASIHVRLRAIDVDGLPVNHTRADIEIRFGNQTVPVMWTPGSNVYAAELSAGLTAQVGVHELGITINHGWSQVGQNVTSCEILRRPIEVVSNQGFNTSWLLVGAIGTATLVLTGLAICVRRWRVRLQAILLMLFTEVGELVGTLCMDIADLATGNPSPLPGSGVGLLCVTLCLPVGSFLPVWLLLLIPLAVDIARVGFRLDVMVHWIADAVVCSRLLNGDISIRSGTYAAAYSTILCFAAVATAISVVYRIRNAVLLHSRMKDVVSQQGVPRVATEARKQVERFEWELVQGTRTKVTLALALMTLAVQDLPMSVMNICMVFIENNTHRVVVASLMVSVLSLGCKLSAPKDLIAAIQRRKELKDNLGIVRRVTEAEALVHWLDDVAHDIAQRQGLIEAIESASDHIYNRTESALFQRGMGMFAAFESNDAGATQLKCPASIQRLETKHDKASGLLFGRVEAEIRATPQEIVAYMLNYDGRHLTSDPESDPASTVRREVLEIVSPFHIIIFNHKKSPGVRDRTFLNSLVAKKVADDPLTYALVGIPIARHDRITSKDEARTIRAENCRSFRLTEVAPGVTKMEYVCSLDLGGFVPQFVTNMVCIPQQLHPPKTMQVYFQQLLQLSKCETHDGWVVGNLLLDLVESNPKELAHAIRTFVNCTAMLRDCSFCQIGAMLVPLLQPLTTADAAGGCDDAAGVAADPASVTEKQAMALGSAIASRVHSAEAQATALHQVVTSHAVLRAMKSDYAWFVPMLEVLTAPQSAEPRRPTFVRRLSAIVAANNTVAPIDVTLSNADTADVETSFSSMAPTYVSASEGVEAALDEPVTTSATHKRASASGRAHSSPAMQDRAEFAAVVPLGASSSTSHLDPQATTSGAPAAPCTNGRCL